MASSTVVAAKAWVGAQLAHTKHQQKLAALRAQTVSMLTSVIDPMAGAAEVVPATAASLMPEPSQLDPTVAYM
jgi:hypothetical protein